MYGYEDTFDGMDHPGEFDEALETLKDALVASVRGNIQEELTRLRASDADMRAKLANLADLERAAKRAAADSERKAEDAKRTAARMAATELLALLAQPKYQVTTVQEYLSDKCAECDERRLVKFVSPRGNLMQEPCECAKRVSRYTLREVSACEVATRDRDTLIWYEVGSKDYASSRTLKRPTTVPEMMGDYSSYGFDVEADAHALADALNDAEVTA